jgi:hypothetical protein
MAGSLRLVSFAALGVFVGANVTEGLVLVPHWRSLAPEDFFAWYAANDRRLLGFFGPLTTATVLLAVASAGVSVRNRRPGRSAAVGAALLVTAAASLFFVYFRDANASFSAASVEPGRLAAELGRWAWWHWLRTAIAGAALVAAGLAVRR